MRHRVQSRCQARHASPAWARTRHRRNLPVWRPFLRNSHLLRRRRPQNERARARTTSGGSMKTCGHGEPRGSRARRWTAPAGTAPSSGSPWSRGGSTWRGTAVASRRGTCSRSGASCSCSAATRAASPTSTSCSTARTCRSSTPATTATTRRRRCSGTAAASPRWTSPSLTGPSGAGAQHKAMGSTEKGDQGSECRIGLDAQGAVRVLEGEPDGGRGAPGAPQVQRLPQRQAGLERPDLCAGLEDGGTRRVQGLGLGQAVHAQVKFRSPTVVPRAHCHAGWRLTVTLLALLVQRPTGRYKMYVEGRGWSVSEKYILACDSVALVVRPRFHDFFSRGLVPLQHYWPVRGDRGLCRSIKLAVDWGNSHPHKAREIGGNASRFVQEELAMERVYDYMFHLLCEYAGLLRYAPTVPGGAVEVTVRSMARGRRGLEREFMMGTAVDVPGSAEPCQLPSPFGPEELEALRRRKADAVRRVETWEDR